ncbi:hypothetical protein ACFQMA_26125 [Halosimplex aquaticum]|uniref:Uncharacterized protein n=2 Tax=Halobacteriales TaxID=2235 RepID=A0A8U0I1Q6_9EURY|nr:MULTISPECIES: hypothetical protein [Halobacteriales]UPV76963.1 hypothetical protein M0R89_22175 [Halorussus limi]
MTSHNRSNDLFRDDPVSADEDVAKLRLELRDYSLEQLEDIGLVSWNREDNVVRKGPYFGEKYSCEEKNQDG